jgi:hypothetical protein
MLRVSGVDEYEANHLVFEATSVRPDQETTE